MCRVTRVRKVVWASMVLKGSQDRRVPLGLPDLTGVRDPRGHMAVRETEGPREMWDLW